MGCVRSTQSIPSPAAQAAVIGTYSCSASAHSYVQTCPMTVSSWATSKTGTSSNTVSNSSITPTSGSTRNMASALITSVFLFALSLTLFVPFRVSSYFTIQVRDRGSVHSHSFQKSACVLIISCRPVQQRCVPRPSLKAAGHSQLRSTGCIGVWQ
jgi:hypothetical protein